MKKCRWAAKPDDSFIQRNQERLIKFTRISKRDWCFHSYSHLPIDSGDCRDENQVLIAYVVTSIVVDIDLNVSVK